MSIPGPNEIRTKVSARAFGDPVIQNELRALWLKPSSRARWNQHGDVVPATGLVGISSIGTGPGSN
jgi:hypothetical protein